MSNNVVSNTRAEFARQMAAAKRLAALPEVAVKPNYVGGYRAPASKGPGSQPAF